LGTRISEESILKPKPLIEVGEKPILWHIMKIYAAHGFDTFGICLGYRGYAIKEYFTNYFLHNSDVTFDFRGKDPVTTLHNQRVEPWQVALVDTGRDTMTGGRVKRMKDYIGNSTFMLTYGDGVGNVDIQALLRFHKSHGKLCTVTATQPTGRFGALDLDSSGKVVGFKEKPKGDGAWISAGFFVMEPQVLDYIEGERASRLRDSRVMVRSWRSSTRGSGIPWIRSVIKTTLRTSGRAAKLHGRCGRIAAPLLRSRLPDVNPGGDDEWFHRRAQKRRVMG
jgi:glucose-1-phosphate cytidylyltransferase